eukprot:CAMPEP_0116008738 /NCGR_PEP_ID=MMETSP0321-20121206/3031_1 /TAXON_ID=163516 /ORGANISM="Leptocylindrus danicus var. danicus, Strain B650" /LENGTH=240 /DNA_ID=CAMNT_0003477597 /DNA_START=669 /DNA_END=1388 /DNA_ORIENTATION=+
MNAIYCPKKYRSIRRESSRLSLAEITTPTHKKRRRSSEDPYVPFIARPLPNSSSKKQRKIIEEIKFAETEKASVKKKAPLINNTRSKTKVSSRKRAPCRLQASPKSPKLHQPLDMRTKPRALCNHNGRNLICHPGMDSAAASNYTAPNECASTGACTSKKRINDENIPDTISPPYTRSAEAHDDDRLFRYHIHGKELMEKAGNAHPFVKCMKSYAVACIEALGQLIARFGFRDARNIIMW